MPKIILPQYGEGYLLFDSVALVMINFARKALSKWKITSESLWYPIGVVIMSGTWKGESIDTLMQMCFETRLSTASRILESGILHHKHVLFSP